MTLQTKNKSEENIRLETYFNNKGVSWDALGIDGALEHSGLSLPGELLPNDEVIECAGTSFYFPITKSNANDHISCEGQVIETNGNIQSEYIYFLGFSTWGDYIEEIVITYDNGKQSTQSLGFSFLNRAYWNGCLIYTGEEIGITIPFYKEKTNKIDIPTGLWVNKLKLESTPIKNIQLPDNPYMHIFAITFLSKNEG